MHAGKLRALDKSAAIVTLSMRWRISREWVPRPQAGRKCPEERPGGLKSLTTGAGRNIIKHLL
jgi:hypothetical protein